MSSKGVTDSVTDVTDIVRNGERQRRHRERHKEYVEQLEVENTALKGAVLALKVRIADLEKKPTVSVVLKSSATFDVFWECYPKRDGENPKKPAKVKFERLVNAGVDPEDIIVGAQRYARQTMDKEPKFICQAITWLNQERWKDENWVAEPQISPAQFAAQLRQQVEEDHYGDRRQQSDDDLFDAKFSGPGNLRRY